MKIVFIFAFALVCGLVLAEEKSTDFEEKAVDVADPKRHNLYVSLQWTLWTLFCYFP